MQIMCTCTGCGQEVPWGYYHSCSPVKLSVDPEPSRSTQKDKPKITKLGGFATLEEP